MSTFYYLSSHELRGYGLNFYEVQAHCDCVCDTDCDTLQPVPQGRGPSRRC